MFNSCNKNLRLVRLFELVKKCSLAMGSNRSFFRNFCNKKMRLMRLFELVKKCSLAIGSNRSFFRNFCNKKMRLMRFERMTYPLKGECSTC